MNSKGRIYLALDLASVTGWALWRDGLSKPISGRWDFRSEWSGDGSKFNGLQRRLHDLREVERFNTVRVEFNPHAATGFRAQYITLGLVASADMYADAYRLAFKMVTTSSWRTEFIGRQEKQIIHLAAKDRARKKGGKVQARDLLKSATIERCRQLGFDPQDDNEADAIGILDAMLKDNGIQAPWYETEVLRPMSEVG